MGWTFTQGHTRADVITTRTQPWPVSKGKTSRTITFCLRANVLWSIREITSPDGPPERYIGCDLLDSQPDFGWGYKALTEEMGPCEVSCPLKYLSLVPEPASEARTGWRQSVRSYHARKNQPLTIGQVVQLNPGITPSTVTIERLKPLIGRSCGTPYRISRRDIAHPQEQTPSIPTVFRE